MRRIAGIDHRDALTRARRDVPCSGLVDAAGRIGEIPLIAEVRVVRRQQRVHAPIGLDVFDRTVARERDEHLALHFVVTRETQLVACDLDELGARRQRAHVAYGEAGLGCDTREIDLARGGLAPLGRAVCIRDDDRLYSMVADTPVKLARSAYWLSGVAPEAVVMLANAINAAAARAVRRRRFGEVDFTWTTPST